jgi:hypothetical protein
MVPEQSLTLVLPERVFARLEELREMGHADGITEVLRRSLSVYDVLLTATRTRGEKVILRDTDGAEREIVIP